MKNRNKDAALLRVPVPVNDVTKATQIATVTAEAVTLTAGAAGTTGSFMLAFGPVASAMGDLVGKPDDTSLLFSGTLTTEVPFDQLRRLAEADNKTAGDINEQSVDYTDYLENGEYYVVYETGRVYYKKSDTGTSITADYKYRTSPSSGGGGGGGDASAANQVITNTKLDTIISQTNGLEGSLTSIDTKMDAQSTAANQDTTNTKLDTLITQTDGVEGSLSSIDTKMDAQATAAKQDTGNTSIASVDTKMSTLLTQTDGIEASLSSIDGGIPAALGQTTGSASMPVVLASDQVTTEASGSDATSNTQNNLTTTSRLKGFNGTTWDRLRSGLTAISSTFTGFLNTMPWATFLSAPGTRTNGQGGPLLSDSVGNLNVNLATKIRGEDETNDAMATVLKVLSSATYAPTEFQNLGANTTANIKATSGNVTSCYAVNDNAAVRYLQLHKTSTTPAGGAVPQWSIPIPPAVGGVPGIAGWDVTDFTAMGINSASGWAYAISTTRGTFTNSATASEHAVFATSF